MYSTSSNINNANKLITYLLIIGLSLSLIFVYFAQERLYVEITYGILSLGSEKFFRSFAVIFIFITVFLNFFDAKGKYLPKLFVAYFLTLGYITVNYLITGPGIDHLTGLMDIKGIGPWVAFGLIFVSFDKNRYELFKKFLIIAVAVISVFVIYNLIDYGIGAYRGQALSKYRVYATNLVWITPFVFLILKNNEKFRVIRVFVLLIGISTALVTQTRSYLLIYLLVLLFDFFHTRKKTYYLVGGFLVALMSVYILLNTESFNTSFELLVQRGVNDTRSNQLIEFLSQVNVFDLIVGRGFESTWYFDGKSYEYLDNQWLLLIWWAGLIPAMMYFYLTAIIPFKMIIKKGQDYETKVESLILILWTLACAGLSIFSTMSVDFYFFIICIIQGRLLYKYSQKNEYR